MRSETGEHELADDSLTSGALPDDLALLGEQLSADAARLLESMPAREPAAWLAALPPSMRPPFAHSGWRRTGFDRRWWGPAAAAILVAAGSTILTRLPTSSVVPSGPSGATTAAALAGAAPHRSAAHLHLTASGESSPLVVPTNLFDSFSEAAQEALLDLIHSDGEPEISVSI